MQIGITHQHVVAVAEKELVAAQAPQVGVVVVDAPKRLGSDAAGRNRQDQGANVAGAVAEIFIRRLRGGFPRN